MVDYYSIGENRRRKLETGKAWAKANPGRHRQKSLDWQRNNPNRAAEIAFKTYRGVQNRFTRAKRRAEQRELSWNITKDQFSLLVLKPCEYCGGSLPDVGHGLDRVDNTHGYDLDNVVPCCTLCNRIKGEALTYVEMKAAMKAVMAVRQRGFTELGRP